MARVRIAVVFLSAVVLGGPVLAAAVAMVSVTKPVEPQPSGRAITGVPGGVLQAPRTTGPTPARPAAPTRFTGLHMTFPRIWRPVTYEVRGPQKAPVRLLCGACPADDSTHTSDARITLMEWNP